VQSTENLPFYQNAELEKPQFSEMQACIPTKFDPFGAPQPRFLLEAEASRRTVRVGHTVFQDLR